MSRSLWCLAVFCTLPALIAAATAPTLRGATGNQDSASQEAAFVRKVPYAHKISHPHKIPGQEPFAKEALVTAATQLLIDQGSVGTEQKQKGFAEQKLKLEASGFKHRDITEEVPDARHQAEGRDLEQEAVINPRKLRRTDAFVKRKTQLADEVQVGRAVVQETVPEDVPDAMHQNELRGLGHGRVKLQETAPNLAGQRPVSRQEPVLAVQEDSQQARISPLTVLLLTVIMAAASGLGAAPYFFTGALSPEYAGLANAIACGVMLAASFDLVHEGEPYGVRGVLVGLCAGAAFIRWSQAWLEGHEDLRFESLRGASARKTVLVVGIMAAHALGEGSGVGVSFCGNRGWAQGVLVTLAIGLHNIPEGLAVATVLVARGLSPRSALGWALATSLPQPLLAVPSFMFVEAFRSLLPLALGFAGGCMVWMVFAELLPDALEAAPHGKVATVATLSAAALEALRMTLAQLEGPQGSLQMPAGWGQLREAGPALLVLLPVVLPAAAAGGLLGWAVPRSPGAGLLGAAAGMLVGLGALSLLDAPLTVWRVVAACGGAACVAVLWRQHQHKPARLKHDHSSSGTLLSMVDGRGQPDEYLRNPALVPADSWEVLGQGGSPRARSPRHPEHQMNGFSSPKVKGAPNGASSKGVLPPKPDALAAAFGLLVLAAGNAAEGWSMGGHIAENGSEAAGRALLPACLGALLRGLLAAVLAGPLLGRLGQPDAGLLRKGKRGSTALWRGSLAGAAVGVTAPAAACAAVLQGAANGDGWSGHAAAAVGGAQVAVALLVLLPMARRVQLQKGTALRGLVGGVLVAGFFGGTRLLLCMLTPYCLSQS